VSRRNRTSRRRTYGKRQHEVRERRPTGAPNDDWLTRDEGWAGPEMIDDARRPDGDVDSWEGYAR